MEIPYYDWCRGGAVFTASNSAAQALSLNSATATGLILSNPTGSGKNLVIIEVCVALATAPAGAAPLIITGSDVPANYAVTHTTPLTVRCSYLGFSNRTAVGLADSAATIPATPTIFRPVGGGPVATGSVGTTFIKDAINGAIIMAQGTVISIQCLTTAISAISSITWAEIAPTG